MSVMQEISENVRNMKPLDYSVLAGRAFQITAELRQGAKKPYQELIDVSAGDLHGIGVKPLSFVRQVLAACLNPQLLSNDRLPVDARERAQRLLGQCNRGSVGSYTAAAGISEIIKGISEFITRRDGGIPSHPGNIYISSGSQWSITNILTLLANSTGSLRNGVLTPAPCYRTTLMSLAGLGLASIPYKLSEEEGWELHVEELHRALESAKGICNPVALYIINPGNPAGQIQSRKSMEEVVQFVSEKKLFLLADEVYQDCVYGEKSKFVSYKKVLSEMGHPLSDTVELASFHSASKGLLGECGLRGGYVELVNIDPAVMKYMNQLLLKDSCAPVLGQMALDLMANPPQPGDPSYQLYYTETQNIRKMLNHSLKRIFEVLNSLPGLCCQPVKGGAFVFPRLYLPSKAIQEAEKAGLHPDTFYCMSLLEEAGVFISPGCDFEQNEGTYHVRICIMVPPEVLEELLRRLTCFHTQFMKDFS